MSARQPFFPQASARLEARPSFTPDPTSSLHGGQGPAAAAEQAEQQRKPGNPFANRAEKPKPAATAGLGMMKKRPSAADKGALSPGALVNNAPRPATSNSYANSRPFQPQSSTAQIPLMAPTPQKPSMMAQNVSFTGAVSGTAFKVPFGSDPKMTEVHAAKNAHISTMEENNAFKSPNDEFNNQNIRFRPASRANGPQRVPMDQGPTMLNPYNNKRAREEEDIEDSPPSNQAQRFKSRDQSESLQDRNMRNKTRSPSTTDRPSSGLSNSMDHSEINPSPDPRRHPALEYQPQGSPPDFKGYSHSQYDMTLPQSTSEASPLHKLLGTDPDAYVKNHMDAYEGMVNRWTSCSIEEWKAGANEIAAEYHKLLDHVKLYVDTKLKLYGTFHAQACAHTLVLDERKKNLDGVRKKLVQESGTVLK